MVNRLNGGLKKNRFRLPSRLARFNGVHLPRQEWLDQSSPVLLQLILIYSLFG